MGISYSEDCGLSSLDFWGNLDKYFCGNSWQETQLKRLFFCW